MIAQGLATPWLSRTSSSGPLVSRSLAWSGQSLEYRTYKGFHHVSIVTNPSSPLSYLIAVRKHVSPGHHRNPSASQSDARPRRMCSTTARSDGWQKSDDLANLLHGPKVVASDDNGLGTGLGDCFGVSQGSPGRLKHRQRKASENGMVTRKAAGSANLLFAGEPFGLHGKEGVNGSSPSRACRRKRSGTRGTLALEQHRFSLHRPRARGGCMSVGFSGARRRQVSVEDHNLALR